MMVGGDVITNGEVNASWGLHLFDVACDTIIFHTPLRFT